MLEDQVAYLLQKYLGNYVLGLSKEALKISVWQGHIYTYSSPSIVNFHFCNLHFAFSLCDQLKIP